MINWDELQKAMYPIRNWEDLSKKWQESVAYDFVRRCYNFTMPEMVDYTTRQLGEDTRNRYTDYLEYLTRVFNQLHAAGVKDILDLIDQVDTQEKFEVFIAQTGLNAADIIGTLKYLLYWFIPMKKPIGSLVKNDQRMAAVINQLRQVKIRATLDLIEAGLTSEARQALAESVGAPLEAVTELVNRADFTRMPWASTATISNIIGAGYGSLGKFAATDIERVSEDFYRYGESIGKNLKYGNEIDNSHRIAKMIPKVIVD